MSNLPLQPLVWFEPENTNRLICEVVTPICEYSVWKALDSVAYSVLYYNRHTAASTKEATGFATIDEAKQWAWNHYNEKMQPYVKPDSITDIQNWFKAAKPEPTDKDRTTQLGCIFEEVAELAESIGFHGTAKELEGIANELKGFTEKYASKFVKEIDNIAALDATSDITVTVQGFNQLMGFDGLGAQREVIRSNNSKMVKGKFEYDENGKIMKPDSYSKPDLTLFVKQGGGK